MEELIKGIIEFREETKTDRKISSQSKFDINYAIGWLDLESKERPRTYTSFDVLKLLKVINNDLDF